MVSSTTVLVRVTTTQLVVHEDGCQGKHGCYEDKEHLHYDVCFGELLILIQNDNSLSEGHENPNTDYEVEYVVWQLSYEHCGGVHLVLVLQVLDDNGNSVTYSEKEADNEDEFYQALYQEQQMLVTKVQVWMQKRVYTAEDAFERLLSSVSRKA